MSGRSRYRWSGSRATDTERDAGWSAGYRDASAGLARLSERDAEAWAEHTNIWRGGYGTGFRRGQEKRP